MGLAARIAAHRDRACGCGHEEHGDDDRQRCRGRDLRDCGVLGVGELEDELQPDEREDHGEAGREVDEPVEQAGDQEEEGAQAEQGEGVGREHDVAVFGDAEDRGNRVEGEENVAGADGQQGEEQRRQRPSSIPVADDAAVVVVGGDRQEAWCEGDDLVVVDLRVGVAVPEELGGSGEQGDAEQQERYGEGL